MLNCNCPFVLCSLYVALANAEKCHLGVNVGSRNTCKISGHEQDITLHYHLVFTDDKRMLQMHLVQKGMAIESKQRGEAKAGDHSSHQNMVV